MNNAARASWLAFASSLAVASPVFAQSADDSASVAPSSAPAPSSSEPSSGAPATPAPSNGTSASGGATTSNTTSSTSSSAPRTGDQRVDPSSIGASSAPIPPATSAERAAATATEPAHTTSATSSTRPQEEDNGRTIDFIFIQAEGGLSVVDLTGLSSNGRVVPTLMNLRQTGYGGGATIGFRSWIFAIAAHAYISRFVSGTTSSVMGAMNNQDFDLGQVMLEGQIRLPVPIVEPYIRVGLGYAVLGAFQLNQMYMDSLAPIHGFTAKAGVGADIWLGKYFTIGIGGDFSIMNLRRDGIMREGSVCPETDPTCIELRQDGDSVGWLFAAHVQAGIHF